MEQRARRGAEGGSNQLVTSHKSQATLPAAAARNENLRDGEFYAVRDVSFELRRGECLGLIGHNGAGKTTLLKMLNGLIKPDSGKITMRGRVGALIALGAGFNPILTGRENIYINGSVLGLSKKEIDGKIDEIIDFAEIGDFIDSPVQNYSSGMSVRLGFAVAAVLIEPDVLILDEVLAVGDMGFTVKCLTAVRRMAQRSAVIFVSHSMQYVSSFCNRVIFMDHGRKYLDTTNVAEGIDRYFDMIRAEYSESGTGEAQFHSVRLSLPGGVIEQDQQRIPCGTEAVLEVDFTVADHIQAARLHFTMINESMSGVVCYPVQDRAAQPVVFGGGRHMIRVPLGPLDLRAGKYDFVAILADAQTRIALKRMHGMLPFRIIDERTHWGQIVRPVMPAQDFK